MVASGVGTYLLQAEPVAVLHNLAADHTALGVVVAFTVHSPSGTYALDSSPDVALFSGQTLAVATLCTDMCENATSAEATVTVGSWASGGGSALTVTSPAYTCGSPGNASGCAAGGDSQGTVSGTVSGTVQPFAQIELTGVCSSASGAIVGSGFTQTVWPGGDSASMSVTVLGSPQPASCQLFATVI